MGRNLLLLAIIWLVFITIASLVSFNSIPNIGILNYDKIIHFLFYFIVVLLWGLAKSKSQFKAKPDFLVVIIAIFYGIVIEILQQKVTATRKADLYDVVANTFGAFTAYGVLLGIKYKFFNKFFNKF